MTQLNAVMGPIDFCDLQFPLLDDYLLTRAVFLVHRTKSVHQLSDRGIERTLK